MVEEEGEEGGEGEEGEEGYEGGDGPSIDPTTWYRWRHHNVPCYIRPPPNQAPGNGVGLGDQGSTGASEQPPQALHLNIVACAVQPDIVLRTDLAWVAEKRCFVLDFGPVPVGQRVTRSIELLNQVRGCCVRYAWGCMLAHFSVRGLCACCVVCCIDVLGSLA